MLGLSLLHPTLFSLRIWIPCFLQAHFPSTTEQGHPAEANAVQRAQRQLQTGCCISRPWPAKPNILHLTKECEGNLTKAELHSRQPVPKLLCFSSKSQLCPMSLTKASWKIFRGLTEKHAEIWQDTPSFIMATGGLHPFWSYALPVALGTLNKPPDAEFSSRDFFTECHSLLWSSLALASTVPSKWVRNAPRFHCS